MTWRVTFWASPWILTNRLQVYQMFPFLLWEWSAFLARMGTRSFVVGRLCLLMKCWSMQEMSAPLLTSARVSTTFIECKGTISWMGICIDLVSNFTVILAHTGEMGEHCIVEVLPFKNPWGWKKFFRQFLRHHHLPLIGLGSLPLGLPSWPVIQVSCLGRRDILCSDVLLFNNGNIILSWCNIFFLLEWAFLCGWHQHPLC